MSWKVTTKPEYEPVSIQQVKDHSNIIYTADDGQIFKMIQAARNWIEMFTGKALITQSITIKFDDSFPCEITIPRSPIQSVTSISYIDDSGNTQVLSSSVYTVDTFSEQGRIVLAYDQSWPTTRNEINAVTIEYVAGYVDPTKLPSEIRHALLMLVDHFYEHRSEIIELNVSEVPLGVKSLLWPLKNRYI
jgi:uncharacterized phiE125 gp8 family phage protein